MSKRWPPLLALLFFSVWLPAQTGPWTQKATMPGNARHRAFTFTLGTNGYIGCGWNGVTMFQDFWEYNPGTDSWAQKADYPGGPRLSPYGFSIGNTGYAGTGLDQVLIAQGDCYSYDPLTNTWTSRAFFGSTPVFASTSVSIGGKGYVAFGDEWNPTYYRNNNLWEYDPVLDAWNARAPLPGDGRRDAVGFVIQNKIYCGTGNDNSGNELIDFWEYDPSTNAWTAAASFAGSARSQAVGFAVGGKGYVGTGGIADVQDFWRFDPLTNSWDSINAFPGSGRENSMSFVIGSRAYVCCGTSGTNYHDLWELNPAMVTGVNETTAEPLPSFLIYPNPLQSSATLTMPEGETEEKTVIVFDGAGKKVREFRFRGRSCTLEKAGLASGIYTLNISRPGGKNASGKLVVQ